MNRAKARKLAADVSRGEAFLPTLTRDARADDLRRRIAPDMTPPANSPPDPKPRRWVAVLLGLLVPCGLGQIYLGQTRRAVLWLSAFVSAALLWGLTLPVLGRWLGYRAALFLLFAGYAASWLAPLADLALIPETRFRPTRWPAVVGFWAGTFVMSIVTALTLRVLLVEAFKVPSGSMIPGFLPGDHVFVNKLAGHVRAPRRGEAIVFPFPENPAQDFMKRAIALPGDTLDVKDGHAWINGWEVPHCVLGVASYDEVGAEPRATHRGEVDLEYLDDEAYLVLLDAEAMLPGAQGPFVAGPGELLVLGDNRNNSHDSRFWWGGKGGGVPADTVRGPVLFRWLSIIDGAIAWSRAGTAANEPRLPDSMSALEPALARCLSQRPAREKTSPPCPR